MYLAKQIIYSESSDHVLQNVYHMSILQKFETFHTFNSCLKIDNFTKIDHKIAKSKYLPEILTDLDSLMNSLSND